MTEPATREDIHARIMILLGQRTTLQRAVSLMMRDIHEIEAEILRHDAALKRETQDHADQAA